jgi:hypothetical protein
MWTLTQPHDTSTNVVLLTIPVSMLNSNTANKGTILQQCLNTKPGRKKVKTFNYGKIGSVLLVV